MIVVADTSPLNYLIQLNLEGLLHALYRRVLIPPAVLQELKSSAAPDLVQTWLHRIPEWIDVSPLGNPVDTTFVSLDPGEREAIQLAEEQHADLLLIDERKGRLEAQRRGLLTTGTLGVLIAAGELGLTDPEAAYEELISLTTFRSTPQLQSSFLEIVRNKRKNNSK